MIVEYSRRREAGGSVSLEEGKRWVCAVDRESGEERAVGDSGEKAKVTDRF